MMPAPGGGGVLPQNLGGGVRPTPWNPYPISNQNMWFSLPYFRPAQKLLRFAKTFEKSPAPHASSKVQFLQHETARSVVMLNDDRVLISSVTFVTQMFCRSGDKLPPLYLSSPRWSRQNVWYGIWTSSRFTFLSFYSILHIQILWCFRDN